MNVPSSRFQKSQDPSQDRQEEDWGYEFEVDAFSDQMRKDRRKLLLLEMAARWHWIALCLILGSLGSLYYLSKAPRQYQAISTILVKQQSSPAMKREQADDMDLRSAEALNTVMERIKRTELLERVAALPEIRQLPELEPPPVEWLPDWAVSWFGGQGKPDAGIVPAPPQLAEEIESWLSVSLRKETRLLDVSITHSSPFVAKAIADSIAVEYQAEMIEKRSKGHSTSADIIVRESESASRELQVAQNALANYQVVLAKLADLERIKATSQELSRRYLPAHPKMAAAIAELAARQVQFLAEFEAAKSSPVDQKYWKSQAAEWPTYGDEGAKLQAARRLLFARSHVLSSEIETHTDVFNKLLTRIQESKINKQDVESEIEISSHAVVPQVPSSPNSIQLFSIASVGSVGIGLLIALLLVLLDSKFHTREQVEAEIRLPVLAVIAEIRSKARPTLAGSQASQKWDERLVFRPGLSDSQDALMFRRLRNTISLLGNEKKRRVTLFSSAIPGEGKTFITSNHALAAAMHGRRTLLIDLDLLRPSVHKMFGLKRDSHAFGATDYLAGRSDFANAIYTETGLENLHLMLSGNRAVNPGELLNTSGLKALLQTAASEYDLVVVDSAPILAVTDTRIIVPLVDNFFLVARAEFVPKAAVRSAVAMLATDDNLPNGIIFNGIEERRHFLNEDYSYDGYAYGNESEAGEAPA